MIPEIPGAGLTVRTGCIFLPAASQVSRRRLARWLGEICNDLQAGDPRKMFGIAGHQRKVRRSGRAADPEIVGADQTWCLAQFGPCVFRSSVFPLGGFPSLDQPFIGNGRLLQGFEQGRRSGRWRVPASTLDDLRKGFIRSNPSASQPIVSIQVNGDRFRRHVLIHTLGICAELLQVEPRLRLHHA
jgi:hypothetical protein